MIRTVVLMLVAAGLLTAFVIVTGVGCTKVINKKDGPDQISKKAVDPWQTARLEFSRTPDLATARRVMTALSSDLNTANQPLPAFSPEAMAKAAEKLSPSPDEARDWASPTYTPMDANSVGEALFFNTVARSLDVDSLPPEQQAKYAFEWVCRQVYDRPWIMMEKGQRVLMPPVPPQSVLRRGYGLGYDREAVFLALARQLNLDAVLIGPPGGERLPRLASGTNGLKSRGPFWAAGVRSGDDVLLYDPWVSAAIPTADGKSILTLSAAKANPKLVTDWLTAKKSITEVTADAVANAVAYASAPVNTVTPRMNRFQTEMQAEFTAKFHLSMDELDSRSAKLPGGPLKWYGPKVEVDAYTIPHVLGTFLPVAEGGYDPTPAGPEQMLLMLTQGEPVVGLRFPVPAELQSESARNKYQALCAGVMLGIFQERFLLKDKAPPLTERLLNPETDFRDKIRRGRFNDAIKQMVEVDRNFVLQRDQARNPDVIKALNEWFVEINAAYDKVRKFSLPDTEVQRADAAAEAEALWRSSNAPLVSVLSAVAEVGTVEVAYWLALAKHEQAQRSQLRYLRTSGEARDAAKAKAAGDWAVASDEWTRFLNQAARFEAATPGRLAHAKALAATAAALMANPDAP